MFIYTVENIKNIREHLIKELNQTLKPLLQPNQTFDMNKLYDYFIMKNHIPYGKKRFEILIKVYLKHQNYEMLIKDNHIFKIIEI